MQVFLAYAAADADTGRRFAAALREAGADVFVDDEGVETDKFRHERSSRLSSSAIFIVLLSRAGLGSSHLRAISTLCAASAAQPDKRLLPVWLEPLTIDEIWAALAKEPPISGSTPATFAVDHLINRTLAACGLPTMALIPSAQTTTPRLRVPPATHRRVIAGAGGLLAVVVALSLLVIHGGASTHPTMLGKAIPPASTSIGSRPKATATVPAVGTQAPTPATAASATPARLTPQPSPTRALTAPTPTPVISAPASPVPLTPTSPSPAQTPLPPSPSANPPTATPVPPTPVPPPLVDAPNGFTDASALQLNGTATLQGTAVRLTDGNGGEAGSVFTKTPVPVTSFTTTFHFALTQATADGIAFVVQNAGATALGSGGDGLGYAGIAPSIAVKFDLWNPSVSTAISTTGLFTNGATPDTPETDLSGSIDLHSGHPMSVTITYANATLTVALTDTTTGVIASQTYPIDIAATIGSSQGYIGFTGATGGLTAVQDIQSWVLKN